MGYVKFLRKYVSHAPILTAGAGLFVFNDKKQVLMQLKTDYNAWGFLGEAMELGESFEETAKRELKVNDDESKEFGRFPIDKLPKKLSPSTKKHLEKFRYLLERALKYDRFTHAYIIF